MYINLKIFKIYTINNYIMDYNSFKTIQELKNICKINKYKLVIVKKTKKRFNRINLKNKTNTKKNKIMEGLKMDIYKTTGNLIKKN